MLRCMQKWRYVKDVGAVSASQPATISGVASLSSDWLHRSSWPCVNDGLRILASLAFAMTYNNLQKIGREPLTGNPMSDICIALLYRQDLSSEVENEKTENAQA
jgi:hypothetical protein